MPTHAHNKAPTADRLVARGGFSLDDAQRETPSRGNTHYYIGQSERSARSFVRQRPEVEAFVVMAQEKNVTSSEQSAQKCTRVYFFFNFDRFHIEENALYLQRKPILSSLCSKTSGSITHVMLRRTACKLPYLARL